MAVKNQVLFITVFLRLARRVHANLPLVGLVGNVAEERASTDSLPRPASPGDAASRGNQSTDDIGITEASPMKAKRDKGQTGEPGDYSHDSIITRRSSSGQSPRTTRR
jgi:hypothetical protein